MNLNELPLDVLHAIQETLTDPTPSGAKREALRAANAGYHVATFRRPPPDRGAPPLAMEAATTSVHGPVVTLRFS